VAGASIEKMLEEMPIYRIWNWLCRPEFFGLDNIPDEKPLIFVGNHTMYGRGLHSSTYQLNLSRV
jgi:1-acyl-sn-glycerol-3-phosphate acyltransferase